MYVAFLLSFASVIPSADVRRIADDYTLTTALERSQNLANELLAVLPGGVRHSPRAQVTRLLDDCKRDKKRLARESKNPLYEVGVLLNYGELCRLAFEHLGPERLSQFKPHPVRGAKLDEIKFNGDRGQKTSYAATLFSYEELKALGAVTHDLIDGLAKKDKPDSFQNAKWKKDLTQLRRDVKRVQDELVSNLNTCKVSHEAKLLSLYAKAVSLTVNFDK